MIDEKFVKEMKVYDDIVSKELNDFINSCDDAEYVAAANLILEAEKNGNRIHITGIGKPGHLSGYGASLLSSTGTPTYFLHATEAVHGSCGQLVPGDVIICISNSGETAEFKVTINAIKNNNCKIISVSGNRESWLAKQGDVHIFSGVSHEGDPLNRAPRASILTQTYVVQRLSILLQVIKGVTPTQYVKWHPGGSLGQIREEEK